MECPHDDPVVEMGEFLNQYDRDVFWLYADASCDADRSSVIEAALLSHNESLIADITELVKSIATDVLPANMHAIMSASNSIGMFAPVTQFFATISEGHGAPCGHGNAYIVSYPGGNILCSVPSRITPVEESLEQDDGHFASWDYEYTTGTVSESSAPVYVLHGIAGTTSFCGLHSALQPLAKARTVRYIYRPAFPEVPVISTHRSIQGYGVYLDIKNMEYRNVDDSSSSEEAASLADKGAGEVNFEEGEEVAGLVFSTLHERKPQLSQELGILREQLINSDEGGTEMKMWKMLDLGLQTAYAITSSSDPVRSMNDILLNFPKHASSLSSSRVRPALQKELQRWYGNVAGLIPSNSLFVNGIRLDLAGSTFNLFSLIGHIQREIKSLGYLHSQGVDSDVKRELLSIAAGLSGQRTRGGMPPITRVDVSKGGKHVISFLNNLEKDPQYKRLPKTVKQLLQPAWNLHAVQRNLYTLVAVVDPVSAAGASMISQLQGMYQQQYPIRIGIALACQNTAAGTDGSAGSEDACRLFSHIKEMYGPHAGVKFLTTLANHIETMAEDLFSPTGSAVDPTAIATSPDALQARLLSVDQAIDIYTSVVSQVQKSWTQKDKYSQDAKDILSKRLQSDFVANSTQYCTHRGLPANSYALNGIVRPSYDISSGIMQLLGREQYILSQMVRKGKITDKTKSIYNAILENSVTYPRFHALVDEVTPDYMDTTLPEFSKLIRDTPFFHNGGGVDAGVCGEVHDGGIYNTTLVRFPVTAHGMRSAVAVLEWLLSNIQEASDGDATCAADSSFMYSHRVSFIPTLPASPSSSSSDMLAVLAAFLSSSQMQTLQDARAFKLLLEKFIVADPVEDCVRAMELSFPKNPSVSRVVSTILSDSGELLTSSAETKEILRKLSIISASFESLAALGDSANSDNSIIVYNARVLVVPSDQSPLHELDLPLLAGVEETRMGAKLAALLRANEYITNEDAKLPYTGEQYLALSGFCGRYATSSGYSRMDVLEIIKESGGYDLDDLPSHMLSIPPLADISSAAQSILSEVSDSDENSSDSDVSLVFVFDPLSRAGQRAATLIQFIQNQLRLPQIVILSPEMEITEFPLQNFFRFVSNPTSPTAQFKNLPKQHTLTVRIDSPEAWNVQSYRAVQDIDNLKCDSRMCGDITGSENTAVSYKIKNLLIAGQCFENINTNPTPPNGLQLVLNTRGENGVTKFSDTLVMQNLGYFQLHANPGLFALNLADGRAAALYTIDGSSGAVSEFGVSIAVRSFADSVMHLYVSKKPGMEHMSLLDDAESDEPQAKSGGMWDSFSGIFGKKSAAVTTSGDDDSTIHVFSLATGQVYERLLRIMMLSVVKRTSAPVKFWLFEYYLSPSFKQTVDAMCKEYGFTVGYVTYKWPEWLTQQTEKQRIIWGYKILFLDVLFPLDVKKVIYVDADQVVRSDLKELWNMDLQGKPYAYTPFCDSRQETLGFQFWRQGYWADHLRGKPYHISALYVVDLQVFRQQAIGDKLRAVYDSLAKDPNSLANLDQDLPNYAQHVVPIHSLPQEWLWCETWCSEKSKKKAKTIDLCNNPLHKEPKLDMARRVINGTLFKESWVELDEEIKRVISTAGISIVE
eukprot:CAMPEP_0185040580 /NCGR_PEP_ID=MMETSP1103-20130426/38799_1 /TAXON_ID=36769 /ORGANISM="Paraphysomonas bandaiensis, Strain Caron Lab Isolate" /LENGTH=1608 /DNA_ID=CAMNT_0027579943 /DNA_START=104 /DNA_END=4931 /DNA_ORIENTATION=-